MQTPKARAALGPAYDPLFEDDALSVGEYATRGCAKVTVDRDDRDHAEDVFSDLGIDPEVLHTTPDSVTFAVELP